MLVIREKLGGIHDQALKNYDSTIILSYSCNSLLQSNCNLKCK